MSAQLLSSKIVLQEEPPSLRTITGVATGVTACLGVTLRGPVGEPTLLTSFESFTRIFGSDLQGGFAPSAVRAFFQNGGERMYFTRVVHYTDIAEKNSKESAPGTLNLLSAAMVPVPAIVTGSIIGPFALADGDTLVLRRDAVAGNATATFNAAPGEISNTPAATYTLANGQQLQVRIDGGSVQTVTFLTADFVAIGAATDAEVADALSALTDCAVTVTPGGGVTITSLVKGTASAVEIVGGDAAGPLGFATSVDTGTGNVADISAVTVAEIKTVVEAAVSNVTVASAAGAVRISATVTGNSGLLQVMPSSTAADELGLQTSTANGSAGSAAATLRVDAKYDGTYSDDVKVLIAAATSGIPTEFNLSVLYKGVLVESWFNLTMTAGAARNAETLINESDGSRFIQVTSLNLSPGNAAAERPANSPGAPAVAFGPLSGGADGLGNLDEVDFVGDPTSRLGFHSFDLIDAVELLICPDMATPAVHNAALTYVSVHRNGEMFFIADPPAGLDAEGINQYVVTTAGLKNTTEHAAIYWPRVKVLNPSAAVYGRVSTITVPPSGAIAGMFARNDGAALGGIYQPPGGVERGVLFNVLGFETEEVLSERVRDLIAPNLINPITRHRGQALAVDDVMTLLAGGNFPTVAERRGVTFIERSIKDGLQFARVRNNDDSLRGTIYRSIDAFLLTQMRVGAFRSTNPQTAFWIDTSTAINPASEQFAGRVHARIGLATQKPARFIILSFSQDTRALDEETASAA